MADFKKLRVYAHAHALSLNVVRHLEIAKGSASEMEQHLISARDLALMSESDFQSLVTQVKDVRRMLKGLLDRLKKSIREREDREKKKKKKREAGSD